MKTTRRNLFKLAAALPFASKAVAEPTASDNLITPLKPEHLSEPQMMSLQEWDQRFFREIMSDGPVFRQGDKMHNGVLVSSDD